MLCTRFPSAQGASWGSRCETLPSHGFLLPLNVFSPPYFAKETSQSATSGHYVKISPLCLMSQKHQVSFVASLYSQGLLTLVKVLCKVFSIC